MGEIKNTGHVFVAETEALRKAKSAAEKGTLSGTELMTEFSALIHHYDELLGEAKLLTKTSDRLYLKLNTANETLQDQAEEIAAINDNLRVNNQILKDTIDELVKAKVGKKASTIVLLIAALLFIVSEGVLEPWAEQVSHNPYLGFIFKGVIAVSLKPIDTLVERYMMRRTLRRRQVEMAATHP